jgi:hypothetical protein
MLRFYNKIAAISRIQLAENRMHRHPDIRPYRGKHPQIAASAYMIPAVIIATVIGEIPAFGRAH